MGLGTVVEGLAGVNALVIGKYKNYPDDNTDVCVLDHVKHGCLSLPGGKVDPGESYLTAMVRELKEELDISDVKVIKFEEVYSEELGHNIGAFIIRTNDIPINNEPEKHHSLDFIKLKDVKLNQHKYNKATRAVLRML